MVLPHKTAAMESVGKPDPIDPMDASYIPHASVTVFGDMQ
jgi:hypothetical protein